MYKLYRFFTFIIYPLLKIYLIFRVKKNKECPKRFYEKLGFSKYNGIKNVIWFHVASLGEIKSILPFINYYSDTSREDKILITSVTLSSKEFFENEISAKNIFHQFAPLDSPVIVRRFLNNWKPRISIFIDSEIWPNLITEASETSKMILLNARISKKSFKKWKNLKLVFFQLMKKFSKILCQNEETFNYLKYFELQNLLYIGNVKLINTNKESPKHITIHENVISWSAMSIHFEEVDRIINVHKIINNEKLFTTFLIPRHLNKIDIILKKIKDQNINVQKISENSVIKKFNGIILIDKYGIADDVFNFSKIVFMGGSFINHGGQNPIEPMKYGCQILHGKYIHNFTEIYNQYEKNGLSKMVLDQNDLAREILNLSKQEINKNASHANKKLGERIFKETKNVLDEFILNEN